MDFLKTLPPDKPDKDKKPQESKPKTPEKLQEEAILVHRLREMAPYCTTLSELSRKADVNYSMVYQLAKEYGIHVTSPSDALIERALEEATLRPHQSLRNVARTLGVSYDNLHWLLAKKGVTLPLVRPPLLRDLIQERAANGMYMAEIAADLGLTRQRINQVCKEAGIVLPDGRYRSHHVNKSDKKKGE